MPYAGAPYAGAPYAGGGVPPAPTSTPVEQRGMGLWLDSTTKVTAVAPLTPIAGPLVPTVIHVVVPTVPEPTLVDGRPQ